MLRSEIDTLDLELKIARDAAAKAMWADRHGEEMVRELLELNAHESDEIDQLNSEIDTLQENLGGAENCLSEAETCALEILSEINGLDEIAKTNPEVNTACEKIRAHIKEIQSLAA